MFVDAQHFKAFLTWSIPVATFWYFVNLLIKKRFKVSNMLTTSILKSCMQQDNVFGTKTFCRLFADLLY